MAANVAGQVAAPARRPAVSAGIPILASKITAPGVPDWAVPRPRITKLIAEGTRRCPLTVVTGPPGAGKTMALALWAAAEPGAGGLGFPGRLRQPAGRLLVLCRRGPAPVRSCHSEGVVGCCAPAGGRPCVPAAA